MLFLCRIADTRGDNVAAIPFFLMFIAGYFMLALTETSEMMLIAGFLMGFNIAQYIAVGQAAAVRRTEKERYGVAISTFNIFLDISYVLGPILHGCFIGEFGYREDFLIMSCVSAVAFVLFIVLHGIPEHRRRSSGMRIR